MAEGTPRKGRTDSQLREFFTDRTIWPKTPPVTPHRMSPGPANPALTTSSNFSSCSSAGALEIDTPCGGQFSPGCSRSEELEKTDEADIRECPSAMGRHGDASAHTVLYSYRNRRPNNSHITPREIQSARQSTALGIDRILTTKTVSEAEAVLVALWEPHENKFRSGSIPNLDTKDVILHVASLQRILLAILACGEEESSVRAAADVLARLCVDPYSGLVIQPDCVVCCLTRILTRGRGRSRDGALRCLCNLATESEEYCEVLLLSDLVEKLLHLLPATVGRESLTYVHDLVTRLINTVRDQDCISEELISRVILPCLNMLSIQECDQSTNTLYKFLNACGDLELIGHQLIGNGGLGCVTDLVSDANPVVQEIGVQMMGSIFGGGDSLSADQLPIGVGVSTLRLLSCSRCRKDLPLECKGLAVLKTLVNCGRVEEFDKVEVVEFVVLCEIIVCGRGHNQATAVEVLIHLIKDVDGIVEGLGHIPGLVSELVSMSGNVPNALILLAHVLGNVQVSAVIQELVESRGVDRVVHHLDRENTRLVNLALEVLLQVAAYPVIQRHLIENGGLRKVVSCFLNGGENRARCVYAAQRIICLMVMDGEKENITACVNAGLASGIQEYLDEALREQDRSSPVSDDVLYILKHIVCKLTKVELGARAVCERGFLRHLNTLLGCDQGKARVESGRILKNLLTSPCRKTCSQILAGLDIIGTLAELLDRGSLRDQKISLALLLQMNYKQCEREVVGSSLIAVLCSTLKEGDQEIHGEVLALLCKLSKVCLTEVCSEVIRTESSKCVWNASGSLPPNNADSDALWKMFQRLRSLEVRQKDMERQKRIQDLERRLERTRNDSVRWLSTHPSHGGKNSGSASGCRGAPVRSLSGKFSIQVKVLGGASFVLKVGPMDTVSMVKSKFQDAAGYPVAKQRLIYFGEDLENHKTLKFYNMEDGAVLYLSLSTGCCPRIA